MKIEIAKSIGFCSGVMRAVKKAEQTAHKYGKVQMFGDIVHNSIVVDRLAKLGVIVIEKSEDIDPELPILLRSHGTSLETEKNLGIEGYQIIDATCPLVKEIHETALNLELNQRQVIIIGDHGHDEVVGIASRLKKPQIINSIDEVKIVKHNKKIGVVVQSTQNIDDVKTIFTELLDKSEDIHFVNTICNPTRTRQNEIVKIARNNDLVLIVGSKNSANTKRLYELSKSINPNSHQVETSDDLDSQLFNNINSIGISSGASTPISLVESIKKSIENNF